MKHLFLTLDFLPDVGGVSLVYKQIAESFLNRGDDIVVIAPKDRREISTPYRVRRISFYSAAMRPRWMLFIPKLFYLIIKERPDHIHVGHILPLGTVTWLVTRLLRKPYSVYIHGMDVTIPQKNIRKRVLMKRILSSAANIFATNNFLRHHIAQLGAPTENYTAFVPVPLLPKVQPTLRDTDILRKKHGLENAFLLLSIGRLVKRKGHKDVIRAMQNILQHHPDVHYVIGGMGEEEARLRDLITDEGLENNIHLLGFIENKELPAWYAAADIFVMPSTVGEDGDIEGFGIVFLEAAFYGTPAIGGASGGMGEAIVDGQTGYLVDDHDVKSLAEKIIYLKTHPHKLEDMGQRARLRFTEQLSWETEFNKIAQCLT